MEYERTVENFVRTAFKAGAPKEQVELFLRSSYVPLPWQWNFHAAARQADKQDGPVKVGAGGARGPGKALSLETPIPTKNGWTTMADIRVGDVVFGMDGRETKVTGISDVMIEKNCYNVYFSDGSLITADEEHLWVTFTKNERISFSKRTDSYRKERRVKRGKKSKECLVGKNTKAQPIYGVRTTKEILDTLRDKNEINHSVPVAHPIDLIEQKLSIHPYLFGVWLGDGHKDAGKITCFDEDIIDEITYEGYNIYNGKAEGLWMIEGLTAVLSLTGLRMNKHIPDIYLRSSKQQRIALLQGLNDTDGYVDKDGSVEFTNTNKKIINGYYELVCSLGIKATCKEGNAMLNGRFISKKWRIRYTTDIPAFRLSRKKEKQKLNGTDIIRRRFIVAVEQTKSVPVRCITVDNESKTYLAGRSFIPTHNSHCVFAQVTLDDCQRVPNLKGLFLRQTGKAAQESFEDLIFRVLSGRIKFDYNRSRNVLKFGNGSRVLLGGFENENDVDKYIGIEYDLIAVEELNQITSGRIDKLEGSLRTSKTNWRPRMYVSFNPGGIGHEFVKQTFVVPHREQREVRTRFIPSTYKENPYLNIEYRAYLEGLSGNLGKAWREGDWDIFEGQFFNEWRESVHVCEPFAVPTTWKRIRTIDHGRTAPTACLWGAIDYDGNLWWHREYYQAGQDADLNAQEVVRLSEGESYAFTVLDSSCFSKTGTGETIAEIYQRNGVKDVQPSPKNRLAGWSLFHEYLRGTNEEPKMRFFSTCVNTIRTIPTLIHDERHPEDLNTDGEDHAADCVSYALQWLHESKSPKTLDPLQQKFEQWKQKTTFNVKTMNRFYANR